MRSCRPEAAALAQLSPEVLNDLSLAERVGRAYHVLDTVADAASPLPIPDAVAAWYRSKNLHLQFDAHWQVTDSGVVVTVDAVNLTASYSMGVLCRSIYVPEQLSSFKCL